MTLARSAISVLLVEDDAGDAILVREALRENELDTELNIVTDGEQALRYLRRAEEYADATRPDLVLLDLNLPRKSGLEVLEEIKEDHDLGKIAVIVLTTSSSDEDVKRAYHERANAFVTKPTDFDRFIDIIRKIDDFYVHAAHLPGREGPPPLEAR